MQFEEAELKGVFVITLNPLRDERGFFARSFCQKEFAQHGLNPHISQCNVSYNKKKGTLRGMHYQVAPHAETKVVYCRKGAVWDVVVDVRVKSPTFGQWQGFELSETNQCALYIPEGFAHGFQALRDDTELFYLMGSDYHPASARGLFAQDPELNIIWPIQPIISSPKDLALPGLKDIQP